LFKNVILSKLSVQCAIFKGSKCDLLSGILTYYSLARQIQQMAVYCVVSLRTVPWQYQLIIIYYTVYKITITFVVIVYDTGGCRKLWVGKTWQVYTIFTRIYYDIV